jgi:hypothetical protein
MLRLCAISLTFLLSSLSCFAWSNLDTGRLAIDIRRVQLHEDIDALQVKLYGVDGKQDKIIAASRDIDLNLLLTDVYTRQVDLMQNQIETDSPLDHLAKVK